MEGYLGEMWVIVVAFCVDLEEVVESDTFYNYRFSRTLLGRLVAKERPSSCAQGLVQQRTCILSRVGIQSGLLAWAQGAAFYFTFSSYLNQMLMRIHGIIFLIVSDLQIDQGLCYSSSVPMDFPCHYFGSLGVVSDTDPDRYSSNRCLDPVAEGWIQAKLIASSMSSISLLLLPILDALQLILLASFFVGAGAGWDCLTGVVVVGFLGRACFVAGCTLLHFLQGFLCIISNHFLDTWDNTRIVSNGFSVIRGSGIAIQHYSVSL
ncbi:hypothetical protein Tco_0831011 [Tanacetum coccineum]